MTLMVPPQWKPFFHCLFSFTELEGDWLPGAASQVGRRRFGWHCQAACLANDARPSRRGLQQTYRAAVMYLDSSSIDVMIRGNG